VWCGIRISRCAKTRHLRHASCFEQAGAVCEPARSVESCTRCFHIACCWSCWHAHPMRAPSPPHALPQAHGVAMLQTFRSRVCRDLGRTAGRAGRPMHPQAAPVHCRRSSSCAAPRAMQIAGEAPGRPAWALLFAPRNHKPSHHRVRGGGAVAASPLRCRLWSGTLGQTVTCADACGPLPHHRPSPMQSSHHALLITRSRGIPGGGVGDGLPQAAAGAHQGGAAPPAQPRHALAANGSTSPLQGGRAESLAIACSARDIGVWHCMQQRAVRAVDGRRGGAAIQQAARWRPLH
jgi:hypothetical protein